MEKYYFVYSVDAVAPGGSFASYGMILDHAELHDTVNGVISSGSLLQSVTVTMYDSEGVEQSERDITKLYSKTN